jgi:hypothetical protein
VGVYEKERQGFSSTLVGVAETGPSWAFLLTYGLIKTDMGTKEEVKPNFRTTPR